MVLEIEDIGDDQDKAFLIGAVLIRLTEHLRLRQRHEDGGPPGLRHLTVLEEAHRLLRDPGPGQRGPAAKAVELFAALLAEVRAYGEGLIVAEQIPTKLIPDVIKNTAVKIVHRLPAADDRAAVGATMNLTPAQEQYIVTLAPGEAAVVAGLGEGAWPDAEGSGPGQEGLGLGEPGAGVLAGGGAQRPGGGACAHPGQLVPQPELAQQPQVRVPGQAVQAPGQPGTELQQLLVGGGQHAAADQQVPQVGTVLGRGQASSASWVSASLPVAR